VEAAGGHIGSWYHWTLVFEASSLKMSVYLFGVLQASTVISQASLSTAQDSGAEGTAKFGNDEGPDGELMPFVGALSDIRLWSRALACTEHALAHYWLPPLTSAPGLQAWFRFEHQVDHPLISSTDAAIEQGLGTMTVYDDVGQVVTPSTVITSERPMVAAVECRFKNVVFFSSPMSSLTATNPTSDSSDGDCTSGQGTIRVDYDFKTNFLSRIAERCEYINGVLEHQYGESEGDGPPYTVGESRSVPHIDVCIIDSCLAPKANI
jgi:hypothetical protein